MDEWQSDAALVAALRAGHSKAFDQLWERYAGPVRAYLRRQCRDPQLAEDLLQDCFIRLASAAPDLSEDASLRPWIYTVARNAFLSRRRRWILEAEHRGVFEPPPLPHGDPLDEAIGNERRGALESALLRLPPELREPLVLHAVEGLEPREAAVVLGLSYDAFRQRLSRARARLRQELADA